MLKGAKSVPTLVPTAEERAALRIVEGYLVRVGNVTGTRLLGCDGFGNTVLSTAIREQFAMGAALCRGVLEASQDERAWLFRLP